MTRSVALASQIPFLNLAKVTAAENIVKYQPLEELYVDKNIFRSTDWTVFEEKGSNLYCYEALIKSREFTFDFPQSEGAIVGQSDASLNTNNPSCLNYPSANDCSKTWQLASEGERDSVHLTASSRSGNWRISSKQRRANKVSIFTGIVLLLFCILEILRYSTEHFTRKTLGVKEANTTQR